MSDLIKALTSAPHGATHIGFYGDDIIFIKEYEESRSDAWGFESKQWQDIEDFDVSLIYGVRAIKDVKTEAELLEQIEQIKTERDALAAQVNFLLAVIDSSGAYKFSQEICDARHITPQQCLRDVRAEAGRAGFVAGADAFEVAQILGSDFDVEAAANEHAAKVRQGGAE